jgi:ribulose-5-phosphate 4-epimerase/fuculose-1-phosphate aldolase
VVHVHPRFTVLMSTLGQTLKPMCQEGIDLVVKPLPVYPHTKTIVTDEEGEEVGRLIAGFKAVLLQGHGATTTGATLEEAVMNMLQLEEQAKLNYQALSALGPDYPSIAQANIDEMHNRTPMGELPHFREVFARRKGQPRVGGVWQYYTAQVARDL